MDVDTIGLLIGITFFFTIFAVTSAGLNFGIRRIAPSAFGFAYWAPNLLTVPALSAGYGIYRYITFKSPSCEPGTYHCFWTLDPVTRAADAAFFILIVPLASVCVSIPVTMWFANRKQTE